MNPILEHIDIKTLITLLGLDMKEHSSYFLGKCCFHDDDKPSFSISKKGFYSCFACGEKGSINSLVYKLKGIGIYKFLNIQDLNSFIFTHPKKEEKLREFFPKLDQFIVKGNLKNPYDSELIMNYLKFRKVSNEFIDYFDIKYTNYAEINNIKFIDRIIIPSFENSLKYFDFVSVLKVLTTTQCPNGFLNSEPYNILFISIRKSIPSASESKPE